MVNRIGIAEIAAIASIRSIETLPPELWLEIQGLMTGRELETGADHAELSKLVKNLLETPSGRELRDKGTFSYFTSLISMSAKPSTEKIKLIETRSGELSLLPSKASKIEFELQNQVETAILKEKNLEKIIAQKPEGKSQQQPEEVRRNPELPPLSKPLQQAINEVVKVLRFIFPHIDKNAVDNADSYKSAASPSSMIQPPNETKDANLALKKYQSNPKIGSKKQPASKENSYYSVIHQRVRNEESSIFKQPMKATILHKEEKREVDRTSLHILPAKKEPEHTLNLGFKNTAQEQQMNQTRQIDRNSIPGAPYQAQFSTADSRRKEKRKYPYYFSDQEEGEDAEQNNDPQQK
jgi:hypothetical protein